MISCSGAKRGRRRRRWSKYADTLSVRTEEIHLLGWDPNGGAPGKVKCARTTESQPKRLSQAVAAATRPERICTRAAHDDPESCGTRERVGSVPSKNRPPHYTTTATSAHYSADHSANLPRRIGARTHTYPIYAHARTCATCRRAVEAGVIVHEPSF